MPEQVTAILVTGPPTTKLCEDGVHAVMRFPTLAGSLTLAFARSDLTALAMQAIAANGRKLDSGLSGEVVDTPTIAVDWVTAGKSLDGQVLLGFQPAGGDGSIHIRLHSVTALGLLEGLASLLGVPSPRSSASNTSNTRPS